MKKAFLMAAIAFSAASCTQQNPFLSEWDTPYGIPPFEEIKYEHYIPAYKAGIEQQNKEIEGIIANTQAPSFANVIEALDRSGEILARVDGVLFNLSESLNSPEMEAIMNEVLPLASEHSDNIFMNPELFAKVKAVYDAPQDGLTREQQMVLKKIYESFVNNGVGLPEDKQERLREINSRLATISQQFASNLLAANNAYARELGTTVSEYYDKMASVEDRDMRRKMFEAYSSRCSGGENDNNALILETLRLKQEKARMLGYSSPAEWILHDKMAANPQNVDTFLAGIMKAAVAKAREEVSEISAMMGAQKVEPWDYMYYMARIKEQKYALNEEDIMPYFQMEKVREGVFSCANKLYGLNFKKLENVPMYHPEMEAFEVTDADGSLVGVQLTDYFPRESKRGGAWMSEFRSQWIDADGKQVRPIIVNVGNFNKPSEGKPALMSIDNVETMFHEFGHALHGLLSNCNYRTVCCTNVARDFVELPSQINENWAFRPELLAEYARHYETGEVIPQALVEKILATRTFNQGFKTTELCAASILDLKWHMLSEIPENADAQWIADMEKKFCAEMGLIDEIIPRYRSSYFNHVFGSSGYSAGYYSYLWAEVLDKDAFQVFVREGGLNRETGMRFRNEILSRGGSDEPMTLYRNFAGSDPDPKYLLRSRGLAQ